MSKYIFNIWASASWCLDGYASLGTMDFSEAFELIYSIVFLDDWHSYVSHLQGNAVLLTSAIGNARLKLRYAHHIN